MNCEPQANTIFIRLFASSMKAFCLGQNSQMTFTYSPTQRAQLASTYPQDFPPRFSIGVFYIGESIGVYRGHLATLGFSRCCGQIVVPFMRSRRTVYAQSPYRLCANLVADPYRLCAKSVPFMRTPAPYGRSVSAQESDENNWAQNRNNHCIFGDESRGSIPLKRQAWSRQTATARTSTS
jgi:hypothetical protein